MSLAKPIVNRLRRMWDSHRDKPLSDSAKKFLTETKAEAGTGKKDKISKQMISLIQSRDKDIVKKLKEGRRGEGDPLVGKKGSGARTSEASPVEDMAIGVTAGDAKIGSGRVLSTLDSADISILGAGRTLSSRNRAKKYVEFKRIPKADRTKEQQNFINKYDKEENRRQIRATQTAGQTRKKATAAKEKPINKTKLVNMITGVVKEQFDDLTEKQQKSVITNVNARLRLGGTQAKIDKALIRDAIVEVKDRREPSRKRTSKAEGSPFKRTGEEKGLRNKGGFIKSAYNRGGVVKKAEWKVKDNRRKV